MKDRNATQAYIRAGYSPNGANTHAARLVANGPISAEIARRVEEYSRAPGIDKVWVLERMKAHIDADLSELFDDKGALLPPKQWPEHMRRLVSKLKVQELAGGLAVTKDGQAMHIPMFTKEVTIEPKLPALGKLLDWVSGMPSAPTPVNNTQVNIDKLLLMLDTPIKIRLQLDHRARELALFNLAIDSKLRGCDLVTTQTQRSSPAITVLFRPPSAGKNYSSHEIPMGSLAC